MVYVPSEQQHEDFLTKRLHKEEFFFHHDFVMNSHFFFNVVGAG